MQSIAAFLVADAIVADPARPRSRGSKPGLIARLRRRGRSSATDDRVKAWVEVPEPTGYPVAR